MSYYFIISENHPIILEIFLATYYSQNYSSILCWSLMQDHDILIEQLVNLLEQSAKWIVPTCITGVISSSIKTCISSTI